MNAKILLFLSAFLLCALLVGGISLAQAAQPIPTDASAAAAQLQGGRYRLDTAAQPAAVQASLAPGVSGGGRYLLQSLEPQPALTASGGAYRLSAAAPAAATASVGCCCSYMPCVLKNH